MGKQLKMKVNMKILLQRFIYLLKLRLCNVLLSPVMPKKAVELFEYLNLGIEYDYSFGYLKSHPISRPNNMFQNGRLKCIFY